MAIARYGPRDIALRMDVRGAEAIVEGRIWLGNTQVTLGPNETTLPGNNLIRGATYAVPRCESHPLEYESVSKRTLR